MKLPRINPIVRISAGLVLMTVSLVLTASLLGITPDPTSRNLEARKSVVEALAVQVASLGQVGTQSGHRQVLKRLVSRNEEVLSAGLRSNKGDLLVDAGQHAKRWVNVPLDQSTATHTQVPIYAGNERWGTLEIRFSDLDGYLGGMLSTWLVQLLLFITVTGFLGYWLFMRRTLRQLDPSNVVPARVKAAMDGLAEGVMLVDENARTVLVNRSLCERLAMQEAEFLEKPASALPWKDPTTGSAPTTLPWLEALKSAETQTGAPMSLIGAEGRLRTFVVNASPITDDDGRSRGALITFDDVTDIERKNTELQHSLHKLESSQREIRKQNKALERLATRDPLTNCLNRRAFFEHFDTLFANARSGNGALSCIMTDIDHFKRINDTHGHATGDEVIKLVALILKESVRDDDVVCRYGGEEFCLVFAGIGAERTSELAERMRRAVETSARTKLPIDAKVTSSFGVAQIDESMSEPSDLVNRADEALYAAKGSGRNRVVVWHPGEFQQATSAGLPAEATRDEAPEPRQQMSEETDLLHAKVQQLEQALSRRTQALRHHEGHDRLTGLPNRILFNDRCQQAITRARRAEKTVAVISMDVDTLKQVNSALGPLYSDRLLKHVGSLLHGSVRGSDTIALFEDGNEGPTLSRLGDNEFGLLISDMDSNHAIPWLVKRLFDSLGKALRIEGHEIYFNASAGIALYPNDGRTPDAMMMNASAARIHAQKKSGRNSYQFYSKDMNAHALKLLHLEAQLRKAIEEDELVLHFQPKFSLRNGAITGVEALVRWPHPELGLIPPSDFIPVAEQSGLIAPLGHWVLGRACQWLKHWQDAGVRDLQVAVNVSSLQFRETDFADRTQAIAKKAGIAPELVELELTESSVMHNLDVASATIRELKRRGFKIAVDDFGTGYSSLSYLKSFPLDTLKIDRSFLVDLGTDATADTLVATICAMAHKLGLEVVAEGVEEEGQIRLLKRNRCDQVQGFLFAPPVTGDEITELASGRVEGNAALKRLGRRWPFSVRTGSG